MFGHSKDRCNGNTVYVATPTVQVVVEEREEEQAAPKQRTIDKGKEKVSEIVEVQTNVHKGIVINEPQEMDKQVNVVMEQDSIVTQVLVLPTPENIKKITQEVVSTGNKYGALSTQDVDKKEEGLEFINKMDNNKREKKGVKKGRGRRKLKL